MEKKNSILEANFSKVVYTPYVSSIWDHFILVEAIGTDLSVNNHHKVVIDIDHLCKML